MNIKLMKIYMLIFLRVDLRMYVVTRKLVFRNKIKYTYKSVEPKDGRAIKAKRSYLQKIYQSYLQILKKTSLLFLNNLDK